MEKARLYRFSPIKDETKLFEAIKYIHVSSYKLCKKAFGKYLSNAGNMGIFCHYDEEFKLLTKIREKLCLPSDNPEQKYFILRQPITFPVEGDIPETTYTHLYIRKPDPYRHHVGDVDFYLEPEKYTELKQSVLNGTIIKGMRMFPRTDLDMIELHDPGIDVLAYVSTNKMTEKVRVKSKSE